MIFILDLTFVFSGVSSVFSLLCFILVFADFCLKGDDDR